MTATVTDFIAKYERLPQVEQREIASEILKRTLSVSLPPITDEELLLNAEEIFLDLDRHEALDGKSS